MHSVYVNLQCRLCSVVPHILSNIFRVQKQSLRFPFSPLISGVQVLRSECKSRFMPHSSGPPEQAIFSTSDLERHCLLTNTWSPNTIKSYSSAQRQFLAFCERFQFRSTSGFYLPATELIILRFIAFIRKRLSASTVKNYLSAIRSLHLLYGLPDPLENAVCIPLVVHGLKQAQGDRRKIKTSVTALVLLSIKLQLDFSNFDHIMFWAACCLAFFGFLRCSEFTVSPSGYVPTAFIGFRHFR